MTIACIGYGSLIWSPRTLGPHLKHPDCWFGDGPKLPVEFARESDRRRITLVIVPGHPASTTYWTPFNHANIDRTASGGNENPSGMISGDTLTQQSDHPFPVHVVGARRQLADREGCGIEHIGVMTAAGRTESALPPALLVILKMWMESKNLSGVVWTELPCGFKANPGHLPAIEDVCAYLEGLIERGEHENAEEYIRKAPRQIVTPYRSAIEQRFGWTPL
ncbi:hypothetical protein [Nitrospina watsonii]|uniref:Gamma-glutamylcyclotransferase n=1 Tax=Nitrospina watsonii TaxID=1323948 RepID=A0ABN8VY58_9BACT|nr:hypothetical protein [Nitrospina watsonii]CAI2718692.1 conserved protein of unknown function [Nitrospina watsonii]